MKIKLSLILSSILLSGLLSACGGGGGGGGGAQTPASNQSFAPVPDKVEALPLTK